MMTIAAGDRSVAPWITDEVASRDTASTTTRNIVVTKAIHEAIVTRSIIERTATIDTISIEILYREILEAMKSAEGTETVATVVTETETAVVTNTAAIEIVIATEETKKNVPKTQTAILIPKTTNTKRMIANESTAKTHIHAATHALSPRTS
jgi:hypothetical protein